MLAAAWLCTALPALVCAPQSWCLPAHEDPARAGLRGLASGDVSAARRAFAHALSLDPRRALAVAGLAAAHLLSGEAVRAKDTFAAAVDLARGEAWPYACLGATDLALADYGSAAEAFSQALARRPHWGAVRARFALALWRQGLAVAALDNARAARNRGDCHFAPALEAAILLSQGSPKAALQAVKACKAATLPTIGPIQASLLAPAPSATTSPTTATAPQPVGPQPAPAAGLELIWPKPGSKVGGRVEIQVRSRAEAAYVVFYVDDQFIAVSNVSTYRAVWDTWKWPDGVHRIRAEAYFRQGGPAASREIQVIVKNRKLTEDSAALARDRLLGEALAELCLPHMPPHELQLLVGRAAQQLGQWAQALDAFEQAFSRWPWRPEVRDAVRSAYRNIGIGGSAPHEIHVLPSNRQVAITFDDGPHPRITPFLLRVLARHRAKATFFLVGKQALIYPDLVRAIVQHGHEIGSHSHTHSDLSRLSRLDVERELVESRWAIARACGRRVVLFRPPGGHYSPTVRQAAADLGFRPVFWTANISRYVRVPPAAAVEGLLADLRAGGIVLLHNGEDATPQVIGPLLDALLAGGFNLGPVGQLSGMPYPYFASRDLSP